MVYRRPLHACVAPLSEDLSSPVLWYVALAAYKTGTSLYIHSRTGTITGNMKVGHRIGDKWKIVIFDNLCFRSFFASSQLWLPHRTRPNLMTSTLHLPQLQHTLPQHQLMPLLQPQLLQHLHTQPPPPLTMHPLSLPTMLSQRTILMRSSPTRTTTR